MVAAGKPERNGRQSGWQAIYAAPVLNTKFVKTCAIRGDLGRTAVWCSQSLACVAR
jgi:hypothetical protein